MKLGILSDTHNNIANTKLALELFRARGVERLVHCGDLTRTGMLHYFAGWRTAFVYGNGDFDRDELRRTVAAIIDDGSIGLQWTAEIDGARLAAMHGDDERALRELIRSGLYDYVFRGHSHVRKDEQVGKTRVINPGALGGKRSQTRSVCILDLVTGEAEFIELAETF